MVAKLLEKSQVKKSLWNILSKYDCQLDITYFKVMLK